MASFRQFIPFQGDLKKPITPEALDTLKRSILERQLFIGKAAALIEGKLFTADGHQTLVALDSLYKDGYTVSCVISYEQKNGTLAESSRKDYDDIMVPYQLIVARGDTALEQKQDAMAKIVILNSQFAELNPQTTVFSALKFSPEQIASLQAQVTFPHQVFQGFDSFTIFSDTDIDHLFTEIDESQRGSGDEEENDDSDSLIPVTCPCCQQPLFFDIKNESLLSRDALSETND